MPERKDWNKQQDASGRQFEDGKRRQEEGNIKGQRETGMDQDSNLNRQQERSGENRNQSRDQDQNKSGGQGTTGQSKH